MSQLIMTVTEIPGFVVRVVKLSFPFHYAKIMASALPPPVLPGPRWTPPHVVTVRTRGVEPPPLPQNRLTGT